jgi:hypothetical protein
VRDGFRRLTCFAEHTLVNVGERGHARGVGDMDEFDHCWHNRFCRRHADGHAHSSGTKPQPDVVRCLRHIAVRVGGGPQNKVTTVSHPKRLHVSQHPTRVSSGSHPHRRVVERADDCRGGRDPQVRGILDQNGAVGMPSEMPNRLRDIAVSRLAQPGEFHSHRL